LLFKKIKSEGLAHFSYIVGDGSEAAVIDPRRDIEDYLNVVKNEGFSIKHIFETHRNEDYLAGSYELALKTGAQIWHADDIFDYEYGKPVQDGQTFSLGGLTLEALHTPGHTPGSFSYVLYTYSGEPWIVFSGDALFAGDVGRVDFLGEDKLKETGGKLYDSIYNRILPLGDEVILCPAHGSGSVCASAIAGRDWTTIGLEKKLNPQLQHDSKEAFVEDIAKMLEYSPYFKKMEEFNVKKGPMTSNLKDPQPLKPEKFAQIRKERDLEIIDCRMVESFASAHIPGAISIWSEGLSSFAGWFVDPDSEILLVTEGEYPEKEIIYLRRMGFDNICGYLGGGMVHWHMSGRDTESVTTVTVQELCNILDENEDVFLLDIRSEDEIASEGEIENAVNIHLTQLPDNYSRIPENKRVYIFCGSGLRSMVAGSLLKKQNYNNTVVVLGGLEGWTSTTCPIK